MAMIQTFPTGSGSSSGGSIAILGCFNTAPTVFAQGDIYYNTADGLIYTSPDGTTWGTGATPKEDVLYTSLNDHKIYSYTNNAFEVYGGTGASSKFDNALKQETDGLYVEDLSNKVNALNIAQKTVNSSLDYCQLGFDNSSVTLGTSRIITLAQSATIPFDYHICGNMQYNLSDHTIHLTANKTYEIYYQTKQSGAVNHMDRLYNATTGEWLDPIVNCDTNDESHSFNYIYTPTVDSDISVRNCWTDKAAAFQIRVSYTNPSCPGLQNPDIECIFSVKEIGREIVIDPVEHIDTTQGIEDTPVGELITKIGTKVPAHYLLCDGKEYNIVDYPELAQCIKDEFGSFNYYGGDGITTFAVPNRNTSDWWTPGLVNGAVPSPYSVYVSSVFNTTQYQKELLFDRIISRDSCWHSAADGSDTDIWVKFDFGSNTYITGLRMAVRDTAYLNQLPSTFTIEGSYDDITYDVIKSYSNLSSPTSTAFREHLFSKPVNYRYYKLNHMTSNAKNNGHDYCSIAELEFAKVDSMSHIKYEPTYFIGTINGYEDRHVILEDKVFSMAKSGVNTLGATESLSEPITNFDNIEFAYSLVEKLATVKDYAGTANGTIGSTVYKSTDNKGLVFDGGSTGEIHITDNKKTYPLTVEIMLKAPKYNHNMLMFTDGPTNFAIGTWSESNLNTFIVSAGTSSPSYLVPTDFFNDTIRTITVTYEDSITTTAYGDGLPLTLSGVSNHWGISGTGDSYIGDRSRNTPFIGTIYGVRIYNKILTPDEILNSHNENINYLVNDQAKATRTNVIQEYDFKQDISSIKSQYQTTKNIRVEDIVIGASMQLEITKPSESSGVDYSSILYNFKDPSTLEFTKTINRNTSSGGITGFTEIKIDKVRGIKNTYTIQ